MTRVSITTDDIDVLNRIIKRERERVQNTPSRPMQDRPDEHEDYLAPEVYLAQAPSSGIAAMDLTGANPVPGVATCDIWRIWLDSSNNPTLQKVAHLTEYVFNPHCERVPANWWVVIERTKYGHWIVQYLLCEETAWTGTGTDSICDFTGEVRVGDGILFRIGDYVYERSYILTFERGELCSKEYGYTSSVYICCPEDTGTGTEIIDCTCCAGPRPDYLYVYFTGTIDNSGCNDCNDWMGVWWRLDFVTDDPDTCYWVCQDLNQPCNGIISLEINCPEEGTAVPVWELHIYENGEPVVEWHMTPDLNDEGEVNCEDFDSFGSSEPFIGHPDECDWIGVRPNLNIEPVWPI